MSELRRLRPRRRLGLRQIDPEIVTLAGGRRGGLVGTVVFACLVSACAGTTPSSGIPPTPTPTPTASDSGAPSSAASSSTATSRISIRLATTESTDSPETQAIVFFANEVKRLSHDSVSMVTLSETADSDQQNIRAVTSGRLEMAIVQARNWDEFGVTSMQALEAPFLITTEGLAVAATAGDLVDELMSGLAAQGVQGLALWPIDLRHPVSFGKPFLAPVDFKGANIRIVGSTITEDVIRALGGKPVHPDEIDDAQLGGAESAFERAADLPQPRTFTGNVIFYPRVNGLFMNQTTWAKLSPDQQSAVQSAADATRQHVIDGIVPDADQAKSFCADAGGKVALADKAGLAEFASALEPITAGIEREMLSKDLIAKIRDLSVPAVSPAIAAC